MVEMPYDEVLLSKYEIMLSAAMRTKLEPDEWKPIVASALIMSKKLRRKLLERMLVGLAILVAISVALFLALPILLPSQVTSCKNGYCSTSPVGYMIAFFVGVPLPFIGTPILALAFGRRLKYVADSMAAELVGTAFFLGVLNKIANMAGGKRAVGSVSADPCHHSQASSREFSTSRTILVPADLPVRACAS